MFIQCEQAERLVLINTAKGEGPATDHVLKRISFCMSPAAKLLKVVNIQWKRINHKQSARWEHLSWVKASTFLFEIFLLGVKKHNNLYLKLVMPSSG